MKTLMLFRVKSSESKLQEGYRTQILLLMVWRILSQSFRTTELKFGSCCHGTTTGKTVLFLYIYFFFICATVHFAAMTTKHFLPICMVTE